MSFNDNNFMYEKTEGEPLAEPLLSEAQTQGAPQITQSNLEAQDAAFARDLAEGEALDQRRAEIEANARAWDTHYRGTDLYYYGTW
eukprot:CAMPEP_0119042614 /NCGR_PEP_ID=MMETSP1177-20130426/16026_1 /TAXON_ID=2985 /ORGANISM="Ochromonas sp, Strain CCMP1899" /LENGTH=85 /DNA_ID=CAMNT_0007009535 /DNA_START=115 /DNA_END=369 /DNA_ORIENTATION=-